MPVDYGYEGLYIDWLARKITYDEFAEGVQKLADMNTDWYDILLDSFLHAHSLSLSGERKEHVIMHLWAMMIHKVRQLKIIVVVLLLRQRLIRGC